MRHDILFLFALLLSGWSGASAADAGSRDAFINELMGRMTLAEKIGQLNLPVADGEIVTGDNANDRSQTLEQIRQGNVGAVFNLKGVDNIRAAQKIAVEQSRLGIPLLFGMDVIHGYETIFPIPLAMACTWNPTAVEESARIAARESTADGLNWTFSPMVDVSRDPRWGRMAESSGEDPYMNSVMGAAMVRGYQGESLADSATMLACVKHFALYGSSESGRDYNTVDMSRQSMFNYYLEPYRAAVEAGAGSVMTSFNIVDGIPATANRWLVNDVLRDLWDFSGFVVTDYGSISDITNHGLGDLTDATAMSLTAGTDMDMMANGFITRLPELVASGRVTEAQIDAACRRILEAKYDLGLFDDPYRYCDTNRAEQEIYSETHRDAARQIATESFVLLKNEGDVLPLSPQQTIALVGPMADNAENIFGCWAWTAAPEKYRSLRQSLEEAVGKDRVIYAKGSNLCYDSALEEHSSHGTPQRDPRTPREMIDEALEAARRSDVIVFAGGELAESSGESTSRTDLELYDAQRDLLTELRQLGKPIVMLNFTGRSTVMNFEAELADALMNVWFGGSEAGDALAEVLYGKVAPSGRLVTSIPKSVGQSPLYYNHLRTGKPLEKWYTKFRSGYLDLDNDPLYPFGYGLSYTTFNYGPMTLSSDAMTSDGSVQASVTVTNTGARDADEVVQLYINDPVARLSRPVKELKAFRKVHIPAGESREVTFDITLPMLQYYNAEGERICDPGDFHVMVGPNSRDLQTATFVLTD